MLATNIISEEKTSKNNGGIIEKKNEGIVIRAIFFIMLEGNS